MVQDPQNPGTPVAVNASITFITALDEITIRVTNLQQETAGSVIQTISAVDFHLQGLSAGALSPTLFSYQGEIGNLHKISSQFATFSNDGLIYNSTGGNVANRWTTYTNYVGPGAATAGAQISGGIQITTMSGGDPFQTILGPANTPPNTYRANNGLILDSPLLRTNANTYIEYVIRFTPGSGVTASTAVDAVRMTWNTQFDGLTELDLQQMLATPEPGTWGLLICGMGLLGWRRLRQSEDRANKD